MRWGGVGIYYVRKYRNDEMRCDREHSIQNINCSFLSAVTYLAVFP